MQVPQLSVHWLLGTPLAVAVLLVIGVVVRWLTHRVVDRVVSGATSEAVAGRLGRNDSTSSSRHAQRVRTMGSLLKSIVTGVVVTVVVVMIVSQLGYNVAPILAGAGILGVAIGFGSQTLVKDFLSGIFMMFEDQYGVGDVIDVGDATGTVEAVGLRLTRLRSIDGTVWYVRNGEINRVGNMSQNWARTVLDIPVGYNEDLTRVRTVLADVGHTLWEDPDHSGDIIEEPEVWGVQSLDADSVLVRVVMKTVPGRQWVIARAMRERVKDRFDVEGIEIPLPQRVVWQRTEDDADPVDA